jgi:hypothetical protein
MTILQERKSFDLDSSWFCSTVLKMKSRISKELSESSNEVVSFICFLSIRVNTRRLVAQRESADK